MLDFQQVLWIFEGVIALFICKNVPILQLKLINLLDWMYVLVYDAIDDESYYEVVYTFWEVIKKSKNRSQDCALRYSTNNLLYVL